MVVFWSTVVLVTEGTEEEVFKKSQQKGKSINTKIMKPESFALYNECPRLVGKRRMRTTWLPLTADFLSDTTGDQTQGGHEAHDDRFTKTEEQ